jgi:hypothetical protein
VAFLQGDGIAIDDLMALTRIPEAICLTPTDPHRVETAGAAIMRPADRALWAAWGPPTDNDYERIDL